MEISFGNSRLDKLANDDKKMLKELGALRAKKFKFRLNQLSVAVNLEETRYLPGNFHELTNIRKGQWACDLDQPFRLIFVPQESPIPVNEEGQYIWTEIKAVEIIEITNYHKED